MPILKRLENLLKEHNISYRVYVHPEAYTAQEIAASMHISGKELAKSVMVKANGHYVMAVMPASCKVDFKRLREVLKESDVKLANEAEFKNLFPDCEPGAEPPFGNLYNVETVVDRSLSEDEHIYFNAGNHYEAIEMGYRDFEELVRPKVAEFTVHV